MQKKKKITKSMKNHVLRVPLFTLSKYTHIKFNILLWVVHQLFAKGINIINFLFSIVEMMLEVDFTQQKHCTLENVCHLHSVISSTLHISNTQLMFYTQQLSIVYASLVFMFVLYVIRKCL